MIWISLIVAVAVMLALYLGRTPRRDADVDAVELSSLPGMRAPEALPLHAAKPRARRDVHVPEIDDDATGGNYQSIPAAVGLRGQSIEIGYCDARGMPSERRITINDLATLGGSEVIYLRSWCHEREAARTFRSDRISELCDLATGEVFHSLQDWAASRGVALAGSAAWVSRAPRLAFENSWAEAVDVMTVLMFAARHDGSVSSSELAVAAELGAALDLLPKGEVARTGFMNRVNGLFPSDADVLSAYAALKGRSGADRLMLVAAIERLFGLDGDVSAEEQAYLDQCRAWLTPLHGVRLAVAGTLPRAIAEGFRTILKDRGGAVVDTVEEATHLVRAASMTRSSSRLKAAAAAGIPILSEADAIEWIGMEA